MPISCAPTKQKSRNLYKYPSVSGMLETTFLKAVNSITIVLYKK